MVDITMFLFCFATSVMTSEALQSVVFWDENIDVFITLDENIYGIHSKRANTFYFRLSLSRIPRD